MILVKSDMCTWRGLLAETGADADSHPTAWGVGLPDDTGLYLWRDGRVTLVEDPCEALVGLDEAEEFDDNTWAALVAEEVTGGRVVFDTMGGAWTPCTPGHPDAEAFGPVGAARPLLRAEVEILAQEAEVMPGLSDLVRIETILPVITAEDGWPTVGRLLSVPARPKRRMK